jgi:hypothetical protein
MRAAVPPRILGECGYDECCRLRSCPTTQDRNPPHVCAASEECPAAEAAAESPHQAKSARPPAVESREHPQSAGARWRLAVCRHPQRVVSSGRDGISLERNGPENQREAPCCSQPTTETIMLPAVSLWLSMHPWLPRSPGDHQALASNIGWHQGRFVSFHFTRALPALAMKGMFSQILF